MERQLKQDGRGAVMCGALARVWMVALAGVIAMGGWLAMGASAHAEQLRIRSSPSGASIYINGSRQGRTPFVKEMTAGRYHIEIRKSGYLTWTSYVQLPQRAEMTLKARMERNTGSPNADAGRTDSRAGTPAGNSRRGGLLIAKTTPSGASVFSGSRYLGKTPLLKFLSVGNHTLSFRQAGFRTETRQVKISTSRSVRLKIKMSPGSGGAPPSRSDTLDSGTQGGGSTQLMILCRPGGKVYLGERYLGRTPVLTAGIAPGTYQLKIKRRGYLTYKRTLTLYAGQQLRIKARLVRGR